MIRVTLADDHKLIREGMQALLREGFPDILLTGLAASGKETLELLENQETEVVLMDIAMPEMSGIETTRLIRQRFPRVKVLMLSMLENEMHILQSIEAGAQGYVLKSAGARELLLAIRMVADGEEYYCSDIAKRLLQKVRPVPQTQLSTVEQRPETGKPPVYSGIKVDTGLVITSREQEVLRLVARGFTTAQIAEHLYISRRTVELHRQNLLAKTGTTNAASLLLYAAAHRLLD